MNKLLLLLVAVALLGTLAASAYCNGKPGQKYVNEQPVWKD